MMDLKNVNNYLQNNAEFIKGAGASVAGITIAITEVLSSLVSFILMTVTLTYTCFKFYKDWRAWNRKKDRK